MTRFLFLATLLFGIEWAAHHFIETVTSTRLKNVVELGGAYLTIINATHPGPMRQLATATVMIDTDGSLEQARMSDYCEQRSELAAILVDIQRYLPRVVVVDHAFLHHPGRTCKHDSVLRNAFELVLRRQIPVIVPMVEGNPGEQKGLEKEEAEFVTELTQLANFHRASYLSEEDSARFALRWKGDQGNKPTLPYAAADAYHGGELLSQFPFLTRSAIWYPSLLAETESMRGSDLLCGALEAKTWKECITLRLRAARPETRCAGAKAFSQWEECTKDQWEQVPPALTEGSRRLSGRIVVLGYTHTTDETTLVAGRREAGAKAQTQFMEALAQGRIYRSAPGWLNGLLGITLLAFFDLIPELGMLWPRSPALSRLLIGAFGVVLVFAIILLCVHLAGMLPMPSLVTVFFLLRPIGETLGHTLIHSFPLREGKH